MTGRHVAALLVTLWCAAAGAAEEEPRRIRVPAPEYGRVVLSVYTGKAKVPAVIFDHWMHRARYTCRVCHVDVGFAMVAGASKVRASENAQGLFCGACHNGKSKAPDGDVIFQACSGPLDISRPGCLRCHSAGSGQKPEHDFAAFVKGKPKARLGNGIDWEAAERSGLVKPADKAEGVSVERAAMPTPPDFSLTAKVVGIPDINFSHAKHAVWMGCEGCHPEPFAISKGQTPFSMSQVFAGQYCGMCHRTVAFPTVDCQRCHNRAMP
jgi:c(7)-type cytochrome triheme protein